MSTDWVPPDVQECITKFEKGELGSLSDEALARLAAWAKTHPRRDVAIRLATPRASLIDDTSFLSRAVDNWYNCGRLTALGRAILKAEEIVCWEQERRAIAQANEKHAEAATEAAKPEATETNPEAAGEDLTESEREALQALLELGAVSEGKRRTLADIAEKAQGQADPELYKWAVSQLGHKGLVQTKRGRQGGVWLSTAGQERATKR